MKSEVLRMFLSGDSQEVIATQLKISVGIVNSLVNEIMKSDDTMDLQRQIAIVSKKSGVKIKQMATNLRYENLVKQSSLDNRKTEKFLHAMDTLFNKFGVPPSVAANHLFSIIETMLRENLEPDKLEDVIKSKISELREIENQIEISNKLLEETKSIVEEKQKRLKIKQKDLNQFHQISDLLEVYEHPEISTKYGEVVRALIEIDKLGYDAKVIVSRYEEFESLTKAIETLEKQLEELTALSRNYKRKSDEEKAKWKDHDDAFEVFTRLIKDGLKVEDIFIVAHILKNDFPQGQIKQLIDDILTYGNIAAAIWKLKREYEAETRSLF
ncbi:MAG: hypothetical protein ABR515_08195 [Nitrososphaeraceae archaeon]